MFRLLTRGASALALALLATVGLVGFLVIGPAQAADAASTVVTLPLGDWIAAALDWVGSIALALVGWVVARWVPTWARQYLTDRVLANAIDYALGAVAGAARGKSLSVPVANAVLAEAMTYAISNAPTLAKWLGGTLRPKLIARLGAAGALSEEASSVTLTGRV